MKKVIKSIGIGQMGMALIALGLIFHSHHAAAQGNAAPQGVVKSVNGLAGQISVSAGPGITITPVGNGLAIGAAPIPPTSINGFTGQVTLSQGPGVTIAPSGNGVVISAQPVASEGTWHTHGDEITPLDFLGTINGVPLEFRVNGQRALRLVPKTNAAAPNIIGGSALNHVASGIVGAVISGGGAREYIIPDLHVFIAGSNSVSADFGVVAGGAGNQIARGAFLSGIGGGYLNTVRSDSSTIAGGYANLILSNAGFSMIGGGGVHAIEDRSHSSVISDGSNNRIQVDSPYSTVSGGRANRIQAREATIGGGVENIVQPYSDGATIAGEEFNSIWSDAQYSTISGGSENVAQGQFSVVPGGNRNVAVGASSLAAGHRAVAEHRGAFVWADSTESDFPSTAGNQFAVRASGGVQFFTDPNATVGVQLAAGGNSWAPASDRNLKENLRSANSQEILTGVLALPIQSYNMKTQNRSIRHIGPMAQDFHAAFGVGEDDKHIPTVDADGVALAAIQGLNQKLEQSLREKDLQIDEQRTELEALNERVAALEKLLTNVLQTK